MKSAIFIDRDGTLIREVNFLHRPDQVALIPGIHQAIKRANALNLPVIVVSNQSGVGRGYFSVDDVNLVHSHISALLSDHQAHIDGYYFCPHSPPDPSNAISDCQCRKPNPGMFFEASRDFKIDLGTSVMIGDKSLDIEAGRNLNMVTVLVETGYGRKSLPDVELFKPSFVCNNASTAIHFFLDSYETKTF
ncbi:MAG: HAD family hydrolase [Bacteroidetes bacterium]|nr:HAD family hydrolase [Bacteroidota bacterium]